MLDMDRIDFRPGVHESPPDERDYISRAAVPGDVDLPSRFSWETKVPLVVDQGPYGTCVGCASAGIKNVHEIVEGNFPNGGLSPLFIYALCKEQDGIPEEEGTYPRVALDVMHKIGALPESQLPYSQLKDVFQLPAITEEMKAAAGQYRIKSYARIPDGDLVAVKQALLASPVLAGVMVTENFLHPEFSFVDKPSGRILGGHAIHLIGWDDDIVHIYPDGRKERGFFIFQNSWGPTWGVMGKAYIPYSLLTWKTDLGMRFLMELWAVVDEVLTQKLYRVQVGGFKVKTNATNLASRLKAQGYPVYIPPVTTDGFYRVQVGAFKIKENAVRLRAELVNAGFSDAFIV